MSDSKSTILYIDHASGIGGAEANLINILTYISRDRFQHHVAGNVSDFGKKIDRKAIAFHDLSLEKLKKSPQIITHLWAGIQQINYFVDNNNVDIVYANTIRSSVYAPFSAIWYQRPFIWHMHDFWLSENKPSRPWLDTFLKRLLIASARVVITNSYATASHLPSSPKIRVVHNGIDLTQFDPIQSGKPFHETHTIPLNAPLVGMVGRLRPWKGQYRFLEVAEHIHKVMPSAYFAIVGGDPFKVNDNYAQLLKLKAESLPFAKQIVFTGQMADVASALAALDVFVHPGDPEPFGLVNVEAMAMAKPVVAFNHGALPEIVVPDQTGHLVPPGDTAVMAEAILSLLGNPEKTKTLGQNGRRRAEAHFDIHRAVSQIETIFDEILAA